MLYTRVTCDAVLAATVSLLPAGAAHNTIVHDVQTPKLLLQPATAVLVATVPLLPFAHVGILSY